MTIHAMPSAVLDTPRGLTPEGLVPMCIQSTPAKTDDAMRHATRLFWERVRQGSSPDECWEWCGARTPTGYGTLTAGKRPNRMYFMAHRLSYELHNGPIPEGKVVMHTCDEPSCVNPAHLRTGTQADNLADMTRKGRRVNTTRKGVSNGAARLTEAAVREIRKRYIPRHPEHGREALAAEFGISIHAVSAVVRRLTWRHVD